MTLKPPILLVGNGRSGTNMLRRLFAAHPDVVDWDEPRTVWVYADPARPHDRFDASDATEPVKQYIRKRFERYQAQHGGRRIFEKTPSNVMRLPYVHAILPESPIVYIVRDPLAQLSSSELLWRHLPDPGRLWARLRETPKSQLMHYAGRFVNDQFRKRVLRQRHVSVWGVRYPGIYDDVRRLTVEQVIAKQWVACCQQADADLPGIDPALVLRVRYEDFVREPVAQFRRIAEHVGLTVPEELERLVAEQTDAGRQEKWRRLDRDVLAACLPLLEPEMRRQGYDVPPELRERSRQPSLAGASDR